MYFKYKKRRNKIPTGNTFTTKKEYFTPEICNTSHIKLDNKTCIKINLSQASTYIENIVMVFHTIKP